MSSRILFLLIALFWGTMTYQLWRSEYVGHNQAGSTVPVELVWRKIVTAADTSSLQMMHQGMKVGYCRWAANVGQEPASGKLSADDTPPEGMVTVANGYQLNLEGNVALNDIPGRLRFDLDVKSGSNNVWQTLDLGLKMATMNWEIHSRANEQTVRLIMDDNKGTKSERVFKFSELENPQMLLEEFGLPASLSMLGAMGQDKSEKKAGGVLPELNWKARNDWISIGHTSVRAYRLEASVLDRYRMRVIVSRVGEILRVELPDGWELVNDQLISL